MNNKNENKSIISMIFTDKELAELNFTPEEIGNIERAELISQMAAILPDSEKEMEAFFAKCEATFPPSTDAMATAQKYAELQKTDPEFLSQIIALSGLIDEVEEIKPAETEKISLADIEKEKATIADEEKQAKLEDFKARFKSFIASQNN